MRGLAITDCSYRTKLRSKSAGCSSTQGSATGLLLFPARGIRALLEAYKQFCIHLQQPISVNNGKDQIIGINKDIDENGNLLIEADGKLLSISTGDVQLIDFQGNNNVLSAWN